MFTRTVITLSFGVRVRPTSTQTTRSECVNLANTPRLCQEAQSTLKFGLKHDFLALKVEEHHWPLLWDKFMNPLALPFEGNSRDYVGYRH